MMAISAVAQQNLTKVEMARRMRTSRVRFDRLLDPDNDSASPAMVSTTKSLFGKAPPVDRAVSSCLNTQNLPARPTRQERVSGWAQKPPRGGFCISRPLKAARNVRNEDALRTRVYIDGYNLYYGCLKNSADKWLDVRALIERILPSILFEHNGRSIHFAFEAPAIKYFTAPILAAFAKSDDSVSCQYHYHTALCAHLDCALEIIKGYHDAKPARAHIWE
jgi:hypothetical protein